MDVMTLGSLNRPVAGLGQDPLQKTGTGMVAMLLVLGLGVGVWFLVSAASDRYTLRGLRGLGKCKVVNVSGRRRKLCWDKHGKLTSNTRP